MQVVLFENIDKLGMQGDVVNVAKGYFRNYLGPRGVAVEASEANLKRLDAKRKKLMIAAEAQRGEAQTLSDRLAAAELNFKMKTIDGKKLFGSVHDREIVELLVEQGFEIERRQVALVEPIKSVGTHDVRVKLVGQIEAHIKVTVEDEAGPAEEEAETAEAASGDAAKEATGPEAEEKKNETEKKPQPEPATD